MRILYYAHDALHDTMHRTTAPHGVVHRMHHPLHDGWCAWHALHSYTCVGMRTMQYTVDDPRAREIIPIEEVGLH